MKAGFGFGAPFFVVGAFLGPWLLEDREMSVFCSFGARLTVLVAPFSSSLLKDIKVAVFGSPCASGIVLEALLGPRPL